MISSNNSLNDNKALALRAESIDDLNVISTLVQDGLLKKKNFRWIKKNHQFSVLVNRFRWEKVPNKVCKTVPFGRVETMVSFYGVLRILSQGISNVLDNEVLSLLRIKLIPKEDCYEIGLFFSGNTLIKLRTELIHVVLQDLCLVDGVNKGTVPKHDIRMDQ